MAEAAATRLEIVNVVTISRNRLSSLVRTARSVWNQAYPRTRYIVIDGNSTDGTVQWLQDNSSQIDYFCSEPDRGIFDAMNKGIQACSEGWVIFMNAGDEFESKCSLSDALEQSSDCCDVLCGRQVNDHGRIFAPDLARLAFGEMPASHQSILYRLQRLGRQMLFDESYPIYADYEQLARIHCLGGRFCLTDSVISRTESGGVSDRVSLQKRKDRYRALYRHFGIAGVARGVFNRINFAFSRPDN